MRPDLFAGPALRDDRHRILARLANGGSVPAPVRRWIRWDAPQRAHLAAVATLLATCAAAWAWLQGHGTAPERQPELPAYRAPPAAFTPPAPSTAAAQQAATIVNAAMPHRELAAAPPAGAKPAGSITVHPRPAKAAGAPHKLQAPAAAPESDEDVDLLAAMLKHAKPQKPSPGLPKD
ncbi:hypothetical protein [Duganella sp. Root198D2]|uniref:hypothetical protein n=1 Tax=Duganella sp. Root198D2 TaxID=1736489 RepID=UPI000709F294|nr:hypothetical protein [Duganella sp. Root198D2]KRC03712.1 hypothetical protein ASE26_02450 [Duganella sp. Root198D2]